MTVPANSDAALDEQMNEWRYTRLSAFGEPERAFGDTKYGREILDRLAAAAERADETQTNSTMGEQVASYHGFDTETLARWAYDATDTLKSVLGKRTLDLLAALLTAQQIAELAKGRAERAEQANTRLRRRIDEAASVLPDPMHPGFPREFEDAQARGLAWLDDDAAESLLAQDAEQENA